MLFAVMGTTLVVGGESLAADVGGEPFGTAGPASDAEVGEGSDLSLFPAEGGPPAFVGFVSLSDIAPYNFLPWFGGVAFDFETVDAWEAGGYLEKATGEGCTVSTPEERGSSSSGSLDAGEKLFVELVTGRLMDVTRTPLGRGDRADAFFYGTVEGDDMIVPGPLPSGMSLEVPGGVFPSITGMRLPDPVPGFGQVELGSPAEGEAVRVGTRFRWEAVRDGRGENRLLIEALDPDRDIWLECTAIDDGEFDLPDDVAAKLGESFSAPRSDVQISRVRTTVHREGEALVLALRRVVSVN